MRQILTAFVLMLTVAACAPPTTNDTTTPTSTRSGVLATYGGPPSTATPSPTSPNTPTPLPTATPTPRTHVVKAREDLWGIALRYGVTLEDLLTANPTVNPRFLSVGATLQIPAPLYTPTPDPSHPPLPTPVSMALDMPACYPSGEGGLWCFASAINRQNFAIEGLSAEIRLYDLESGEIISRSAYGVLNQVPPGGSMALSAYYPAPVPEQFEVTAELITALPVPVAAERFLSVQQTGTEVNLAGDGLSAQIRGVFRLSDPQATAGQIAAVAIAYDAAGRVTGIRLWESAEPLSGSNQLNFEMTVYAAGAPIERVVVLVEARP